MAKETAKKDAGGGRSVVRVWVARARAVTGLIGFSVVTWVSHKAGMGMTDAMLRGLVGAFAFSLVGWFCALLVLQGLMRTAARNAVTPPARPRATAAPQEALPPPPAT